MVNEIKENFQFLKNPGSVLTIFSTGVNTLYAISQGNTKNVLFELYDNEQKTTITTKLVKLNELDESIIDEFESSAKYYC